MTSLADRIREPLLRTRRRVRQMPGGQLFWRLGVLVVGLVVVLGGLALVPLPGPGWLLVFLGLSILASEFVWAARLLRWTKVEVASATAWALRQAFWLRVIAGTATVLMVVAVAVAYLYWNDVGPFFSGA